MFPCDSAASPQKGAGLRLYQASVAGDLVSMATALAEGAEVNGGVAEEEGRTALIGAAVGVRDVPAFFCRTDSNFLTVTLQFHLLPAGVAAGLRVPAAERSQHQPPRPEGARRAARCCHRWTHGVTALAHTDTHTHTHRNTHTNTHTH